MKKRWSFLLIILLFLLLTLPVLAYYLQFKTLPFLDRAAEIDPGSSTCGTCQKLESQTTSVCVRFKQIPKEVKTKTEECQNICINEDQECTPENYSCRNCVTYKQVCTTKTIVYTCEVDGVAFDSCTRDVLECRDTNECEVWGDSVCTRQNCKAVCYQYKKECWPVEKTDYVLVDSSECEPDGYENKITYSCVDIPNCGNETLPTPTPTPAPTEVSSGGDGGGSGGGGGPTPTPIPASSTVLDGCPSKNSDWKCPGGDCDKCGCYGWWPNSCGIFCNEKAGEPNCQKVAAIGGAAMLSGELMACGGLYLTCRGEGNVTTNEFSCQKYVCGNDGCLRSQGVDASCRPKIGAVLTPVGWRNIDGSPIDETIVLQLQNVHNYCSAKSDYRSCFNGLVGMAYSGYVIDPASGNTYLNASEITKYCRQINSTEIVPLDGTNYYDCKNNSVVMFSKNVIASCSSSDGKIVLSFADCKKIADQAAIKCGSDASCYATALASSKAAWQKEIADYERDVTNINNYCTKNEPSMASGCVASLTEKLKYGYSIDPNSGQATLKPEVIANLCNGEKGVIPLDGKDYYDCSTAKLVALSPALKSACTSSDGNLIFTYDGCKQFEKVAIDQCGGNQSCYESKLSEQKIAWQNEQTRQTQQMNNVYEYVDDKTSSGIGGLAAQKFTQNFEKEMAAGIASGYGFDQVAGKISLPLDFTNYRENRQAAKLNQLEIPANGCQGLDLTLVANKAAYCYQAGKASKAAGGIKSDLVPNIVKFIVYDDPVTFEMPLDEEKRDFCRKNPYGQFFDQSINLFFRCIPDAQNGDYKFIGNNVYDKLNPNEKVKSQVKDLSVGANPVINGYYSPEDEDNLITLENGQKISKTLVGKLPELGVVSPIGFFNAQFPKCDVNPETAECQKMLSVTAQTLYDVGINPASKPICPSSRSEETPGTWTVEQCVMLTLYINDQTSGQARFHRLLSGNPIAELQAPVGGAKINPNNLLVDNFVNMGANFAVMGTANILFSPKLKVHAVPTLGGVSGGIFVGDAIANLIASYQIKNDVYNILNIPCDLQSEGTGFNCENQAQKEKLKQKMAEDKNLKFNPFVFDGSGDEEKAYATYLMQSGAGGKPLVTTNAQVDTAKWETATNLITNMVLQAPIFKENARILPQSGVPWKQTLMQAVDLKAGTDDLMSLTFKGAVGKPVNFLRDNNAWMADHFGYSKLTPEMLSDPKVTDKQIAATLKSLNIVPDDTTRKFISRVFSDLEQVTPGEKTRNYFEYLVIPAVEKNGGDLSGMANKAARAFGYGEKWFDQPLVGWQLSVGGKSVTVEPGQRVLLAGGPEDVELKPGTEILPGYQVKVLDGGSNVIAQGNVTSKVVVPSETPNIFSKARNFLADESGQINAGDAADLATGGFFSKIVDKLKPMSSQRELIRNSLNDFVIRIDPVWSETELNSQIQNYVITTSKKTGIPIGKVEEILSSMGAPVIFRNELVARKIAGGLVPDPSKFNDPIDVALETNRIKKIQNPDMQLSDRANLLFAIMKERGIGIEDARKLLIAVDPDFWTKYPVLGKLDGETRTEIQVALAGLARYKLEFPSNVVDDSQIHNFTTETIKTILLLRGIAENEIDEITESILVEIRAGRSIDTGTKIDGPGYVNGTVAVNGYSDLVDSDRSVLTDILLVFDRNRLPETSSLADSPDTLNIVRMAINNDYKHSDIVKYYEVYTKLATGLLRFQRSESGVNLDARQAVFYFLRSPGVEFGDSKYKLLIENLLLETARNTRRLNLMGAVNLDVYSLEGVEPDELMTNLVIGDIGKINGLYDFLTKKFIIYSSLEGANAKIGKIVEDRHLSTTFTNSWSMTKDQSGTITLTIFEKFKEPDGVYRPTQTLEELSAVLREIIPPSEWPKILVKRSNLNGLDTLSGLITDPRDFKVEDAGLLHGGRFKGFLLTDGRGTIFNESITHDQGRVNAGFTIYDKNYAVFLPHNEGIAGAILHGVNVEDGAQVVATRLLNVGVDRKTKIRIMGTSKIDGTDVALSGSLEEIILGGGLIKRSAIREERQIYNFAGLELQQGSLVNIDDFSFGIVRNIDGTGVYIKFENGKSNIFPEKEFESMVKKGEVNNVGPIAKNYSWGYASKKDTNLLATVRREDRILGFLLDDGKIVWSTSAPDHTSLRQSIMVTESEIHGLFQYIPGQNKWTILEKINGAADKLQKAIRVEEDQKIVITQAVELTPLGRIASNVSAIFSDQSGQADIDIASLGLTEAISGILKRFFPDKGPTNPLEKIDSLSRLTYEQRQMLDSALYDVVYKSRLVGKTVTSERVYQFARRSVTSVLDSQGFTPEEIDVLSREIMRRVKQGVKISDGSIATNGDFPIKTKRGGLVDILTYKLFEENALIKYGEVFDRTKNTDPPDIFDKKLRYQNNGLMKVYAIIFNDLHNLKNIDEQTVESLRLKWMVLQMQLRTDYGLPQGEEDRVISNTITEIVFALSKNRSLSKTYFLKPDEFVERFLGFKPKKPVRVLYNEYPIRVELDSSDFVANSVKGSGGWVKVADGTAISVFPKDQIIEESVLHEKIHAIDILVLKAAHGTFYFEDLWAFRTGMELLAYLVSYKGGNWDARVGKTVSYLTAPSKEGDLAMYDYFNQLKIPISKEERILHGQKIIQAARACTKLVNKNYSQPEIQAILSGQAINQWPKLADRMPVMQRFVISDEVLNFAQYSLGLGVIGETAVIWAGWCNSIDFNSGLCTPLDYWDSLIYQSIVTAKNGGNPLVNAEFYCMDKGGIFCSTFNRISGVYQRIANGNK